MTVVPPVKVLTPARVSVPDPPAVRPPVPLMTPPTLRAVLAAAVMTLTPLPVRVTGTLMAWLPAETVMVAAVPLLSSVSVLLPAMV